MGNEKSSYRLLYEGALLELVELQRQYDALEARLLKAEKEAEEWEKEWEKEYQCSCENHDEILRLQGEVSKLEKWADVAMEQEAYEEREADRDWYEYGRNRG